MGHVAHLDVDVVLAAGTSRQIREIAGQGRPAAVGPIPTKSSVGPHVGWRQLKPLESSTLPTSTAVRHDCDLQGFPVRPSNLLRARRSRSPARIRPPPVFPTSLGLPRWSLFRPQVTCVELKSSMRPRLDLSSVVIRQFQRLAVVHFDKSGPSWISARLHQGGRPLI